MKWKTLKDLPGIPAGTEGVPAEDEMAGMNFGRVSGFRFEVPVRYCEDNPDFFERVEDEPEFVDVEIITEHRSGNLMCEIDDVCWFLDNLPRLPLFVGFVFDGGNLIAHSRRYSCGQTFQATHARFKRAK